MTILSGLHLAEPVGHVFLLLALQMRNKGDVESAC